MSTEEILPESPALVESEPSGGEAALKGAADRVDDAAAEIEAEIDELLAPDPEDMRSEKPIMDQSGTKPLVHSRDTENRMLATNGQEICPFCNQCQDDCKHIQDWRPPGASTALHPRRRICADCIAKNPGGNFIVVAGSGGTPVPDSEQPMNQNAVKADGDPNPLPTAPDAKSISSRLQDSLGS